MRGRGSRSGSRCLVTEDGVLDFCWIVAAGSDGRRNENVQLLPFEEIQQHIRDLINLARQSGAMRTTRATC